ncbi:hypothetical protein QWY77_14350 [Thalassotalea ponticola]|uniref:hypothetical protein n=1 Tax=Thalassotalea ponticola TaxID=1523392 RepID=UPI0025B44162|nr:hypothetical protein [Thalassotalea ponticola]MDN3653918.1 hypothetical protein [Thalassotalea ponticola]
MQLIKSLFCFQGHDNADRFLALAMTSIFATYLINTLVVESVAIKIFTLVVCASVVLASAVRRSRDSDKRLGVACGAFVSVVVAMLVVSFSDHALAVASLALPLMLVLYLFALPSTKPRAYITGYSGPIDLTELVEVQQPVQRSLNQRVEPNFFGQAQPQASFETNTVNRASSASLAVEMANNEFANRLYNWGQSKHTLLKSLVLLAVILWLSPLVMLSFSVAKITQPEVQQVVVDDTANTNVQQSTIDYQHDHKLAMPDDYYLLLNQYDGLIIHWQADRLNDGEIWSQHTAKGDDSCQFIEFNSGETVRTLNVVIENKGDYYANFSPLDSATVVELLALRGNFTLCGYRFSLKGSQRALNSHPKYVDWAN